MTLPPRMRNISELSRIGFNNEARGGMNSNGQGRYGWSI